MNIFNFVWFYVNVHFILSVRLETNKHFISLLVSWSPLPLLLLAELSGIILNKYTGYDFKFSELCIKFLSKWSYNQIAIRWQNGTRRVFRRCETLGWRCSNWWWPGISRLGIHLNSLNLFMSTHEGKPNGFPGYILGSLTKALMKSEIWTQSNYHREEAPHFSLCRLIWTINLTIVTL